MNIREIMLFNMRLTPKLDWASLDILKFLNRAALAVKD